MNPRDFRKLNDELTKGKKKIDKKEHSPKLLDDQIDLNMMALISELTEKGDVKEANLVAYADTLQKLMELRAQNTKDINELVLFNSLSDLFKIIVSQGFVTRRDFIPVFKDWSNKARPESRGLINYVAGFCFEKGILVNQDKNTAIEFYGKAGQNNYALAYIRLAKICLKRKSKTINKEKDKKSIETQSLTFDENFYVAFNIYLSLLLIYVQLSANDKFLSRKDAVRDLSYTFQLNLFNWKEIYRTLQESLNNKSSEGRIQRLLKFPNMVVVEEEITKLLSLALLSTHLYNLEGFQTWFTLRIEKEDWDADFNFQRFIDHHQGLLASWPLDLFLSVPPTLRSALAGEKKIINKPEVEISIRQIFEQFPEAIQKLIFEYVISADYPMLFTDEKLKAVENKPVVSVGTRFMNFLSSASPNFSPFPGLGGVSPGALTVSNRARTPSTPSSARPTLSPITPTPLAVVEEKKARPRRSSMEEGSPKKGSPKKGPVSSIPASAPAAAPMARSHTTPAFFNAFELPREEGLHPIQEEGESSSRAPAVEREKKFGLPKLITSFGRRLSVARGESPAGTPFGRRASSAPSPQMPETPVTVTPPPAAPAAAPQARVATPVASLPPVSPATGKEAYAPRRNSTR